MVKNGEDLLSIYVNIIYFYFCFWKEIKRFLILPIARIYCVLAFKLQFYISSLLWHYNFIWSVEETRKVCLLLLQYMDYKISFDAVKAFVAIPSE